MAELCVYAEQENGVLSPVTFELLQAAAERKEATGEPVSVLLYGGEREALLSQLIPCGADRIYYQPATAGAFCDDAASKELAEAIRTIAPACLLLPATPACRSVFPRVAIRLNAGLTADCTRLSTGPAGQLIARKPSFGEQVQVDIETTPGHLPMVTIRPGIYAPIEAQGGSPEVLDLPACTPTESGITFLEVLPEEAGTTSMLGADLILSAGKGVMEPESFALVEEVARKLGGSVGGTRPLMDAGLLPFERQIGQTGYTVRPKICLYLGVSGALQHTEGVKDCPLQIAVNTDPEAAIFAVTEYGVAGDAKAILQEMLKQG